MDEPAFMVLSSLFVLVGWAGIFYSRGSRDARRKRALFPRFMIALALLMIASISAPLVRRGVIWAPLFYGPPVALVFFLYTRAVRFCGVCGATTLPSAVYRARTSCGRCGAALERSST